jgi:hypothetical protein|nr:MAG TPA: hypothetical protein [Microviridae sp.]
MSLKNNDCVAYISPICEDLQIESFSDSVSVHSDSFILSRINELVGSRNLQDAILARFESVSDSLSPEFRQQLDSLSDDELVQQTDSRYQQFLSDRSQKIKQLMLDFDAEKQKVEDSLKQEELTKLEAGLKDLVKRFNSYDV